jgi:hypothetical protein
MQIVLKEKLIGSGSNKGNRLGGEIEFRPACDKAASDVDIVANSAISYLSACFTP